MHCSWWRKQRRKSNFCSQTSEPKTCYIAELALIFNCGFFISRHFLICPVWFHCKTLSLLIIPPGKVEPLTGSHAVLLGTRQANIRCFLLDCFFPNLCCTASPLIVWLTYSQTQEISSRATLSALMNSNHWASVHYAQHIWKYWYCWSGDRHEMQSISLRFIDIFLYENMF